MRRSIKTLLGFLAYPQTLPLPFLNNDSVRVFILKNEVGIKNNVIGIERAKLWNIHGDLWLEDEHWGIETHQIKKRIRHLGQITNLLETQIEIPGPPIVELLLKSPAKLQAHKRELAIVSRLVASCILTCLEKHSSLNTKPPITKASQIAAQRSDSNEPFVYASIHDVVHTLTQHSERTDEAFHLFNLLEEEKEGTLARIIHQLNTENNNWHYQYKTINPYLGEAITHTAKEPLNQEPSYKYIPLETIVTLLEEQMIWCNWLRRCKPSSYDASELARYIHKSQDYNRIFQSLCKDQHRGWEHSLHQAAQNDLLALLFSTATKAEINLRISKKMVQFRLRSAIFHTFYHGGLINQILYKYHWAFGWGNCLEN